MIHARLGGDAVLHFLLITSLVAAVPRTCGSTADAPGQPEYRATITILNRTEALVVVTAGALVIDVPPCEEATREDFPVNFWQVTSPGSDTFRGGGGIAETHSYILVADVVGQFAKRPDPLPECRGRLPAAPPQR